MVRLTKVLIDNGSYTVDDNMITHDINGYSGPAVERLASFENIYDDLVLKQNEISKELEKLRNEGKTHSVKFKELMVKKLTNSNIIILFRAYGLE